MNNSIINQVSSSSNSSTFNSDSSIFNYFNSSSPLTSQTSHNLSSITNEHLWTITTCNLRGLSNKTKRDLWFQYSHNNNWDIIISTETDGNSIQSEFWKSQFYQTWWTHGPNKLGQGIGISLNTKLASRVFKKHSWKGRILVLDLSFPKKTFFENN